MAISARDCPLPGTTFGLRSASQKTNIRTATASRRTRRMRLSSKGVPSNRIPGRKNSWSRLGGSKVFSSAAAMKTGMFRAEANRALSCLGAQLSLLRFDEFGRVSTREGHLLGSPGSAYQEIPRQECTSGLLSELFYYLSSPGRRTSLTLPIRPRTTHTTSTITVAMTATTRHSQSVKRCTIGRSLIRKSAPKKTMNLRIQAPRIVAMKKIWSRCDARITETTVIPVKSSVIAAAKRALQSPLMPTTRKPTAPPTTATAIATTTDHFRMLLKIGTEVGVVEEFMRPFRVLVLP
ncbi:hypothetical protein ACFPRL_31105 [Pseudoclavibacter helvolus]